MKLTQHFLKRSGERDIYPEMLVKIMSGDYAFLPSEQDPSAGLIVGKQDGKLWTVIVNIETEKIITARRAHGKEIKLYEQKFRL